MPEKADAELPIEFRALILRSVEFERFGSLSDDQEHPLESDISLGVTRLSPSALSVDLIVKTTIGAVASATVTYAASFDRTDEVRNEEAQINEMKFFAARVAPTVLYPYVREMTSTLFRRSGLPDVTLPVINFANLFDPAEFEVVEQEDEPLEMEEEGAE